MQPRILSWRTSIYRLGDCGAGKGHLVTTPALTQRIELSSVIVSHPHSGRQ